jgi:2-oxoglutarate ferredoxin oxidoreductase subunit alpha
MMEGVTLPPERSLPDLPERDWTVGYMKGRESRHITSINLVPESLEAKTKDRFVRYKVIAEKETRFEATGFGEGEISGAGVDLTLVAYGTAARIALGVKKLAEKEGLKLGVFRPVTLWPFPYEALGKIAAAGKPILTVEMSLGQLVEDVKLAVLDSASKTARTQVHLLGHSGGIIPTEEEVFAEALRIHQADPHKN